jgi:hypothetical protein
LLEVAGKIKFLQTVWHQVTSSRNCSGYNHLDSNRSQICISGIGPWGQNPFETLSHARAVAYLLAAFVVGTYDHKGKPDAMVAT